MLVFIDDSGDPGFKLDKGSSKFFVISLVIFNDNLEAEKTDTGAIRRSYSEEKTDKDIYKGIIKKHITSEWKFK